MQALPRPAIRRAHSGGLPAARTAVGSIAVAPELWFTAVSRGFGKTEGVPVANFTIASTSRTFDPASKEWKDGETLFLRASVWRDAAENAAASLAKGSRVVASGVLKPRTYETKAGEKRTVIELEVEEIGLSLKYTAAAAIRAQRRRDEPADGTDQGAAHPADGFRLSPRRYADDDPWFGKDANPDGRVTLPGAAAESAW